MRREVSLSMKELNRNAPKRRAATMDFTPFEKYPSDERLRGVVKRILHFGAFVSVTLPKGGATAEGLLPATQIRKGRVRDINAELAVGQEIDVWIKEVANH